MDSTHHYIPVANHCLLTTNDNAKGSENVKVNPKDNNEEGAELCIYN